MTPALKRKLSLYRAHTNEADRLLWEIRDEIPREIEAGTPQSVIAAHLGWTRQRLNGWLKISKPRRHKAEPLPTEAGRQSRTRSGTEADGSRQDAQAQVWTRVGDVRAMTPRGIAFLWTQGDGHLRWELEDGEAMSPLLKTGVEAIDLAAARSWILMGKIPYRGGRPFGVPGHPRA